MSNERPSAGAGRALSVVALLAAVGSVGVLGAVVISPLGTPDPEPMPLDEVVTFLPEVPLGGDSARAARAEDLKGPPPPSRLAPSEEGEVRFKSAKVRVETAPASEGASSQSGEQRARKLEQKSILAQVGKSQARSSELGGLIGTKGTQVGSGGLGTRGSGLGGGGTASGLGGLGVKGRGSGASGYGGGPLGAVQGGSMRSGSLVVASRDVADATLVRDPAPAGSSLTPTVTDARSTFAADVDTGSYTFARRLLTEGGLPSPTAVRVEEFVNFFRYDYRQPKGKTPLAVDAEVVPHPTKAGRHIVRLGVQAKRVSEADRKPVRLTFLVDTSGSMRGADRLGLAQKSMVRLLQGLGDEDTVSIVTYAGSTQVVLAPTPANRRSEVTRAIQSLGAGGGTAMDSGMALAYAQAEKSYAEGAENRVIVLSDGDANIGRTGADEMLQTIRRHAEGGITLTTVGFGTGNFKDARMERLADAGDGVYVYIDGMEEANRVFGEQLGATLESVARDVKLQVAFDPAAVKGWRQVGYVNRQIADEDFRDDAVDAGEVGSGHQVTALYEVELAPGWRAQKTLATVHLRAKPPGPDRPAKEWSEPVRPAHVRPAEEMSPDTAMALAAMHLADGLHDRDPAAFDRSVVLAKQLSDAGRRGAAELVELSTQAKRALAEETASTVAVAGSGDPQAGMDRVFRRYANQFQYCYQRELARVPGLAGEVQMKVVVGPTGYVQMSKVRRSTIGSPAVEACLEQRTRRMRFPPTDTGEVVVLHYPMHFEPT